MRLAELVTTSRETARASGRRDKVARLAEVLRRTPSPELEIAVSFLCGTPRQPKLGVGFAAVRTGRLGQGAGSPSLTLTEADAPFEPIPRPPAQGSSHGN